MHCFPLVQYTNINEAYCVWTFISHIDVSFGFVRRREVRPRKDRLQSDLCRQISSTSSSRTQSCVCPSLMSWNNWFGTKATRPTSNSVTATVEDQESELVFFRPAYALTDAQYLRKDQYIWTALSLSLVVFPSAGTWRCYSATDVSSGSTKPAFTAYRCPCFMEIGMTVCFLTFSMF